MGVDALRIPRGWPSIPLPGYREHPTKFATYTGFEYDSLPPIERALDNQLTWLLSEQPVPESLGGGHVYEGDPVRPATGPELDALLDGTTIELPAAFSTFIRTREPRTRIRSCTACYLDLADFPVSVGDKGWLIHFLSDQQWVGHWYLYVDADGSQAVVWTYPPYGFVLGKSDDEPDWAADFDPRKSGAFAPGASASFICASSFSEFLYRFWLENEVWYALDGPDEEMRHELTKEQRRYVEHYLKNGAPAPPRAS